ncbi:DsbA family protein [Acidomonas methanolica]|uniref:Thioredoxin domain-containing protein n=1 Tax=Acidomonas methanolica NBRC 104435 TaxID=1231351 RepID=A0A023D675_ACIMT|nr:thioredoxin domain-containing protein [Acidomonas methanolica]MBU2655054.1 DsbA family protein [Acidomonas methanolica]TCS29464.1 protein-disulfide isomerase [Acidomonas methanolica]GAJ29306.1 hypothetical protein Amme_059_025 [Acidomonas methanolica NBRC 104435]GBQ45621.1 hypothetical protein AA0498_0099 [Acidomonas methanolica]GEK99070.1 hypothetical protein AME01nite_15690 [Acidomonas methanolica NBRC 104435]
MWSPSRRAATRWFLSAALCALVLGTAGRLAGQDHPATQPAPSVAPSPSKAGPPWIYGRPDARFTVIEYADLECPYCRAYFPVLRRWIDVHPEVDWQWRHLPLPMHQPAALREARLAECAGAVGGASGFWNAVTWIYGHTRGDGRGIPDDVPFPWSAAPFRQCLDSPRPDRIIREQAAEASRAGIDATPTLRLVDRETGRSLLLPGPVDGDALLSGFDLLAGHQSSHVPTPSGSPAITPSR